MIYQPTHASAIRRAQELYERGFARPAIDVLEAELTRSPDNGAAWRLRAVLLAREGRMDEAFDNIQQALTLVPLGYEGLLVLAGGYLRAGRRELARCLCLECARNERFPTALWEPLYALLTGLELWSGALRLCQRALRERPEDDVLCFVTAQALRRCGRPPEHAAAMLRKAVHLNPRDVRYRVALTVQLIQLQRSQEAQAHLEKLSHGDLAAVDCRCCLQKLLPACIQLGDGERAAAVARRLAQLTPVAAAGGKTQ